MLKRNFFRTLKITQSPKGLYYKGFLKVKRHFWVFFHWTLIKEQKRELDIIFNNTPVGIVLTQLGNILKTNLTFQNMLGFSEKELTKRTLVSFLIPEDFEESEYNLFFLTFPGKQLTVLHDL